MRLLFTLFLICIGISLNAQCEYYEDFETYPNSQVPAGWTVINTTGVSYVTASVQQNSSAPSPPKYFRMSNSTASTGDFMIVLPLNTETSDGNHRITFYLNGSNGATSTLQVGTINAVDGTGTFQQISEISGYPTGTTWAKYYVNIPSGTNQYIAFRHSLTAFNNVFSFDNICFQEIPTCLEVSGVNVTNLQAEEITFGWTASGSNETAWEHIVQTTDLPAPTSSTSGTEVGTNSATVSGLDPDTEYNIFVRAKCSGTDYGAWIGPVKTTTLCSSYVANYFSGFEDNVSAQDVKPCWSAYDTGTGDLKTFGTTFGVTPSEGNLLLRFYFPSSMATNSLVLISPEFSDLTTDKQIRFKMNKRAGYEANMKIEIGTVASPTDMDSFVLLDDTTLTETTVVAATWTEFTVNLTNYNEALGHHYIAFRPQHSGAGATQYIFMDEFNYEYNLEAVLNDEPITAHPILASSDYQCENAKTGTFEGATRSPEFPCNTTPYIDYKDLWYKFEAPATGRYAFSLNIAPAATANLVVWQGTLGSLTPISAGCLTRYTQQDLVAGQTYYVSIGSPEPTTEFELCIIQLPESTNDEPANAIELLESTTDECENALEGNTALATHSTDSACGSTSKDVWYLFTPSQTAEYTFRRNYLNGSAPTGISVYSGTPGNLVQVNDSCGGGLILVNLLAGETYYVAVSSSSSSNPVYFSLCAYPSPPPPVNDACGSPIDLTVGTTFEENMIIGDNTSATVNLGSTPAPNCGALEFDVHGRDVWFTVTVPESGNFVVETRKQDGSLLTDTVMETYTGTCGTTTLEPYYYNMPPPNQGQAYCNDQFVIGGNQFAGIRFDNKQPGEQVIIRVWGWARQFGEFKISVYDDTETCASPTNITISDITDGTATISWDAPSPAPVGGYEYKVQAQGAGYPGASTGIQTTNTTVSVSSLTSNYNYEVYVRAICSTNDSSWEGPILFTTLETCDSPSNIMISEIQSNQATVSWDAPTSTPEGGYYYIVQPAGTGNPDMANAEQTDETSVTVLGLDASTAYEVYVSSFCALNGSSWEGPILFITLETCDSPTNITISAIQNNQATVSWDAPTTAPEGGYYYIVQPAGTGNPDIANAEQTDETSVTVLGLDAGTQYEVYVSSFCTSTGSAWEGPVVFETTNMGVNDWSGSMAQIYPNPVSNILNIESKGTIDEVILYNLNGQITTRQEIHAKQAKLDVSSLAKGIYILKIFTENHVQTVKMVKK